MTTYSQKLLDPRWQRKSAEIKMRDDFTCQECGCKNKTVHAHHIKYKIGKEPWDYPDSNFITLCKDCHYGHHKTEQLLAPESSIIQLNITDEYLLGLNYDNPYSRPNVPILLRRSIENILKYESMTESDFEALNLGIDQGEFLFDSKKFFNECCHIHKIKLTCKSGEIYG